MSGRPLMPVSPSRFALFYALYFALLGCIAPFWGLYLKHLSFTAVEIGSLMALFGVVRILAPNMWAAQSQRFRGPVQMVRMAGLLTLVCFSLIYVTQSFYGVAAVMIAYGFFWAAMLPQYEVLCMQSLSNQVDRYSRVRMWGSVGFIVTVVLLGAVLQALSISVLPAVMWTLMFCIVANAWLMPHASHPVRPENQTEQQFWRRLLKGPVAGFILLNVLLQLSFGPYYTFFSIYLGEAGYSASLTGIIWGVGVIAEVVLFWQFGRIMHLLSWRGWVVLSLALTAVRWMLNGYLIGSLWVLLLLQILHAFSFGVMHAVSMRYVQTLFPDHLQGRAQALYSSVSFGLGGAVGAWVSGLLWEPLGGTLVFVLAGAASLAGAVIAWLSLSPDEQRQSRQ